MIDVVERKPLPQVCRNCQEVKEYGVDAACYNCDNALDRFELVRVSNSLDEHRNDTKAFYIKLQIDNIKCKEQWHAVMGMIDFALHFNMISYNQSIELREAADDKLCLLDAAF